MRSFMRMKKKTREIKKPANIMLTPTIKKKGERVAAEKGLTLSQLIEILIYEYAE